MFHAVRVAVDQSWQDLLDAIKKVINPALAG